jgi:Ca2+-binding RTX toxin-like protein
VGGSGYDTFVFADGYGSDVITDFTFGQDKIYLDVASVWDFSDVDWNAYQVGYDTVIDFGFDTLTLKNINANDLIASDFYIV